jgi:L-fucose isomerase-like protein
MYQNIKLGFCPIGKFVFSHEDAKVYKTKLEEKMKGLSVQYAGIDVAVFDGIVRGYEDIGPAVSCLKGENIDCLFIPHCNFGTESAAGMIAKKLGVPVLLWGPKDGAPLEDGTRLRDTLCGMFATSKVLRKMEVPFTYINNCEIDDALFTQGLDQFLRAANVVKRTRNCKIGLIGNRINFFWSTIVNESELLQKFGIEILPIDIAQVIVLTENNIKKNRRAYINEVKTYRTMLNVVNMPDDAFIKILSFRDVMKEFASDNELSALAVESFMSLVDAFGSYISFAQSLVSDAGFPCICESDIHGAISAVMAEAAALHATPAFLADLTIKHPVNDNGLLLWHDSFPLSLKDPDCRGELSGHWILHNTWPGMCHWKLRDGEITIMRFDGETDDYRLFAEKAWSIRGPYTRNTYLWVQVEDLPKLERKVIEGPYIHHTACIYGDYRSALREACKYLKHVIFDN